jgi:8-oxo-dGTP diphosphatase
MENFSTCPCVAAVALIDESGRVLMQKRRLKSVHGGLWEFPGGKLEVGESAQDTAIREMREELGLQIDSHDLEPLSFASGSEPEGQLVILLYICRRWSGIPDCRIGEAIAWYRADELENLAMPPLDYPLARKVTAMLEGG